MRLEDLEVEEYEAMKKREYDYQIDHFHGTCADADTQRTANEQKQKYKHEVAQKMATLKEQAKEYTAPETKNIADLDLVSVSADIENKEVTKEDGTSFSYNYIMHDNVEYRVPNVVLKQLKEQIEANPKLENFSVSKTGSGLATTYTVIPK